MSRPAKTLERVLRGTADANIAFDDLCGLLRHLGFDERVKGSHHIFTRDGIAEILNLQPKGAKAKAYQVAQVRDVIVGYGLAGDPDDPPADPSSTPGDGNE
ncbi:MAG: type II toxin-antitoxin system HicA family toxin [Gemmataceae bacterium]|nr:type II toxin-antitoxin system HicA family toxin [Gemmataceae bacterium]